jgi:hypothetical protein
VFRLVVAFVLGATILAVIAASAASLKVDGGTLQVFTVPVHIEVANACSDIVGSNATRAKPTERPGTSGAATATKDSLRCDDGPGGSDDDQHHFSTTMDASDAATAAAATATPTPLPIQPATPTPTRIPSARGNEGPPGLEGPRGLDGPTVSRRPQNAVDGP